MAKQKAKNLCRKATYMNRCVLKGVSNISTFITISIRTIVQLSYIFLFFYLKQNQFLFYQSFRFLRICYWKDSLFCCLFVGTPIEKWVCHKSKLDAIRGKIFLILGMQILNLSYLRYGDSWFLIQLSFSDWELLGSFSDLKLSGKSLWRLRKF